MCSDTKKCNRCGEVMPITEFPIRSGKPYSLCKVCSREYFREYAKNNKEKMAKNMKKFQDKLRLQTQQRHNNMTCTSCGSTFAAKSANAKYCPSCKTEKKREWRREETKRNAATYKARYERQKDTIRERERNYHQNRRDTLSDSYIVKLIVEKTLGVSITHQEVRAHPGLIEAKRQQLLMLRELKHKEKDLKAEGLRLCKSCGTTYPLSTEFFYWHPAKQKFDFKCKVCCNIYQKNKKTHERRKENVH